MLPSAVIYGPNLCKQDGITKTTLATNIDDHLFKLLFFFKLRPIHKMRFVSYDSFVLLCWNQRDNLQISEFERGCVQLFASCVLAFSLLRPCWIDINLLMKSLVRILLYFFFLLPCSGTCKTPKRIRGTQFNRIYSISGKVNCLSSVAYKT